MYNLKTEDINKYILKLIITDKNIDINLICDNFIIDIETFELPKSKFFNKNVFPSKFLDFMDNLNENSIKAIRSRNSTDICLISFLKKSGNKFIIDFLPMNRNILNRYNQEHLEFDNFDNFEEKVFYLLENIMKIDL
jgi:hypothetical protein